MKQKDNPQVNEVALDRENEVIFREDADLAEYDIKSLIEMVKGFGISSSLLNMAARRIQEYPS